MAPHKSALGPSLWWAAVVGVLRAVQRVRETTMDPYWILLALRNPVISFTQFRRLYASGLHTAC